MNDARRIRVGVSACLLGEAVRYDGGHKYDPAVARELARHFELVPICPEVAIGLGVPRPPIQVVRARDGLRVLGVDDPALDVTADLDHYLAEMEPVLATLSGYVFKSRSPSCGVTDTPVFDAHGRTVAAGAGRFAAGVRARDPDLPVTDERALRDPAARATFIERVRAFHRRRSGHAR